MPRGQMSTQHTYNTELKKYLAGELSPEERYVLEKKALDDPFLWDTIEGYTTVSGDHQTSIDRLRKRLAEQKKEKSRVIPMRWLTVAAASLALLASAYFFMDNNEVNVSNEAMVAAEDDVSEAQDVEESVVNNFSDTQDSSSDSDNNDLRKPTASNSQSQENATPRKKISETPKSATEAVIGTTEGKERSTPQLKSEPLGREEAPADATENEDQSLSIKNDLVVEGNGKVTDAKKGLKSRGSLNKKAVTAENDALAPSINSSKLKSSLKSENSEASQQLMADAAATKPELFHSDGIMRYLRNEGWWKTYESRLPAFSRVKILLKDGIPSLEFPEATSMPDEIKSTLVSIVETFYKKQGKALPPIEEFILVLKSK